MNSLCVHNEELDFSFVWWICMWMVVCWTRESAVFYMQNKPYSMHTHSRHIIVRDLVVIWMPRRTAFERDPKTQRRPVACGQQHTNNDKLHKNIVGSHVRQFLGLTECALRMSLLSAVFAASQSPCVDMLLFVFFFWIHFILPNFHFRIFQHTNSFLPVR